MINAKQKGNAGEREFSQFLRDLDPTAKRDWQSGAGLNKGDIQTNLDYHIEVKRVERLNIYKATEQASRYAAQGHQKPLVAFRRNRESDWWVTIRAADWKELERKAKEPKTTKTESQQLQWKLKRAIQALKELSKELER